MNEILCVANLDPTCNSNFGKKISTPYYALILDIYVIPCLTCYGII